MTNKETKTYAFTKEQQLLMDIMLAKSDAERDIAVKEYEEYMNSQK